jgi:thiamine biosynthesis protein ThiI
MERVFLLKIGELMLKGDNRGTFERQLTQDIRYRLKGHGARVVARNGRFFVFVDPEKYDDAAELLRYLPGITAYAHAVRCEKIPEEVKAQALRLTREGPYAAGKRRFKAEVRRSDKSFPLSSYETACAVGDTLCEAFPDLVVDVHNPDFVVNVEIREKAFIYVDEVQGIRGLPVGSSGKGMLLLSGGIDSPVAGYLMALRGLRLEAIHFHAYPYTSKEAQQKVEDLAKAVSRYSGAIRLHMIPFTDVQMLIKQRGDAEATTLMLRAAMVQAADMVAKRVGAMALVSGESLGQVASQTAANMRFTGSYTDLPLFRPLIGTDKQATIDIARKIGTYEISIQPFEDCCVLFSPKHPLLNPDYETERANYAKLGLSEAIAKAVEGAETLTIRPR